VSVAVVEAPAFAGIGRAINATIQTHEACENLYLRWYRETTTSPRISTRRGGGLLPRQSTCTDPAAATDSATARLRRWRLAFHAIGDTAAEMARVGCSDTALTEFANAAADFTAIVEVPASGTDLATVRWSWPDTTTAQVTAPVTPSPSAGIDTEQIPEWTWDAAFGRLAAACLAGDETDDDTRAALEAAEQDPTDDDDRNALSRAWAFVRRIPGDVIDTTLSAARAVFDSVVWAVQTGACLVWEIMLPDAPAFTSALLNGPGVSCRVVSAGTVGAPIGGPGENTASGALVCDSIGLFTWWVTSLTVLSTGVQACAGPEIMISEMIAPVADITDDDDNTIVAADDLDQLDGRYLSTCDGTILGEAADRTREWISALLYFAGVLILLGCFLALPKVFRA
jgi:hypothetical protein